MQSLTILRKPKLNKLNIRIWTQWWEPTLAIYLIYLYN